MSPKPELLATTRDRALAVAADLYVRKGHDGFSFGDVAGVIGTTRANIHHHFGTKQQLMAELIASFTADAVQRIAHLWTSGEASFKERLLAQIEDLRAFHGRFNPAPDDRNVWSPISRMRLDLPSLGDPAMRALEQVQQAYERCLPQAVAHGIASGELWPELEVQDVARVIRVVVTACPPLTQDSGGFAEIELMLRALGRILCRP